MFTLYNVGKVRENYIVGTLLKDLQLYVQVVIISANVVISRCCFAEDGTDLFKVRAARAARLLFLTRPIKFLICGVVGGVVVALEVIDDKALSWLPKVAIVQVS